MTTSHGKLIPFYPTVLRLVEKYPIYIESARPSRTVRSGGSAEHLDGVRARVIRFPTRAHRPVR